MAEEAKNPTNRTESEPYKKEQFDAFIATIKGNAVGHWVQIARVLGVSNSTIHEWKKLPQAQKAIKDQIERIGEEMERAGKDDWKMWESKMKMLGVSPIEKQETDLTSGGEKVIPILGNSVVTYTDDFSTNNSNEETAESKEED